MSMGETIKKLRVERGMTQEELASAVGYSHKSSINKIEQGKADISQPKIVAIARALGVTPDYLFFGEGGESNLVEAIKDFSEEERKELESFIRYIISKRV